MKKLLTIYFLLALSIAANAQEKKTYYDNGQLKSIRKITDGKSNGECKFYFENGQLEQIGIFIDNKQNGEWKYYHENGKLKIIGKLIDSKQNGEWKYYHENGKLKNIGKLIDNKFTGEWKYYHENGELLATKFYDDNGNEIEIKKAPIETKANNDLSNYRDYEFPQIQKYLDKIIEIDLGYEKLAKLYQILGKNKFTLTEKYDGEVSTDYYENIKWEDFESVEYVMDKDIKMYIRCDFIFKTDFKKTTKYSTKDENILSFYIFAKDLIAIKQAVEEFEENKIYKYTSIQNSTQLKLYKDAKTWKTISSLIGENLEGAKKILKNNGMVVKKNGKDEETGLDIWSFVEASEKDDEYDEYAFLYTIAFKGNKVVLVYLPYKHYSSKENINFLKDLSELKKDLKLFGYDLTDKKIKKTGGMGVSWKKLFYLYNKPNQNNEVRIFHDSYMDEFKLFYGEKKYLDLMSED